ncbi:MAG: hypothetical protein KGI98_14855 [Euryarchaeota archaeon]|nr:hypothetical protein [Euryarchaeota archaeon]MDE1879447.1 hypothetical protein [Euryarchaeota archaeon]
MDADFVARLTDRPSVLQRDCALCGGPLLQPNYGFYVHDAENPYLKED